MILNRPAASNAFVRVLFASFHATQSFPHPLSSLCPDEMMRSNAKVDYENIGSYRRRASAMIFASYEFPGVMFVFLA